MLKCTNHFESLQELENRNYVHPNIELDLAVVDTLKRWNKKHTTIKHDEKFIKLLLVHIFTSQLLAVSSLNRLEPRKIRFIRGLSYFSAIQVKNIILMGVYFIFSPRCFRCASWERYRTVDPFQRRC